MIWWADLWRLRTDLGDGVARQGYNDSAQVWRVGGSSLMAFTDMGDGVLNQGRMDPEPLLRVGSGRLMAFNRWFI